MREYTSVDDPATGNPSHPASAVLIGAPTYGRTPRALLRDPAVSPSAKALWATLEDYSSPDRPMPFPSQATMADHMGVTERSIRNWLIELREAGWLAIVSEPTAKGKRNSYQLFWAHRNQIPGSGGVRNTDSGPVRNEGSGWVRNVGSAEEEPLEEEPIEEDLSSQSDLHDVKSRKSDEEQPKHRSERLARARAAVEIVARQHHAAAAARGSVRNPEAHLTACISAAERDHLAEAQLLAHQHRQATAIELAAMLDPPSTADTAALTLYEAAEARRVAAMADAPPEPDRELNLASIEATKAALRAARAKGNPDHA